MAPAINKDRLAATVKVNGVQCELPVPARTSLKTIRAQRNDLRISLRALLADERHILVHDAARYLQQISTELVSIADRRHHIGLWV